jgi:hypothetical protein
MVNEMRRLARLKLGMLGTVYKLSDVLAISAHPRYRDKGIT